VATALKPCACEYRYPGTMTAAISAADTQGNTSRMNLDVRSSMGHPPGSCRPSNADIIRSFEIQTFVLGRIMTPKWASLEEKVCIPRECIL
jgi:hypothetical protein